jgi:hypothetical protein
MGEREVRGRWRSFLKKWNRGELAAGWYDPEMYAQVVAEGGEIMWRGKGAPEEEEDVAAVDDRDEREATHERDEGRDVEMGDDGVGDDGEDDEDVGPLPPTPAAALSRSNTATGATTTSSGPRVPSFDDLAVARETAAADAEASRADATADLRHARRADRAAQRERLDELAPRPDAGSHERRLEKRRAVGDRLRAAARQTSPGVDDVRDDDLMGGGGGGVADAREELARLKDREQRKKTERELRREQWDRALKAQREERIEAWRVREEGTVGMLKELARQRFG